jgi:hypothetical protein
MIRLQRVLTIAVLGTIALWMAASIRAEDKRLDPVGTWKWSIMSPNGQTRETTLKVSKDGDQYSALIARGNRETKADKVEFKDGQLSFEVTNERRGQKVTAKYKGKVQGDTIKGTIDIGRGSPRDWEAKRQSA